MTSSVKPSADEIRCFAERHRLDKLSPEHLDRMAELAVYVADLGRTLPRPPDKAVTPYERPDRCKRTM
jgi:hypothetical protein